MKQLYFKTSTDWREWIEHVIIEIVFPNFRSIGIPYLDQIGCCALRPYDDSKGILEIGFHIRSKHWRRGYATEAARAVIAYAFNSLRASALFAGHNPENKPSRDLLLKLGFHYTHDEFYEPTGLQHPSYLLTAEEYERLPKI